MRLWVKRGVNGTPASIQLQESALIDDVKDAVFRKYPVALARAYDSPDVSICVMKATSNKGAVLEAKVLAVDEELGQIIAAHFPGGQRVEDALVIQIPSGPPRASPFLGPNARNSPLAGQLALMHGEMRDFEYFPPTPPLPQSGPQIVAPADSPQAVNSSSTTTSSNSRSVSASQLQQAQQYNVVAANGSITPVVVTDGAIRPAPPLHMNTAMRMAYRNGNRPGLARSSTTSTSTASQTPRSEGGINFYPRGSTRGHSRTTSVSSNTQNSPIVPDIVTMDDQLSGASPVTAQDLLQPGPYAIAESADEAGAATAYMRPSSATSSEQDNASTRTLTGNRRTRLDSPAANRPMRPGMGARTNTQSKLSIVSPANSPHSSTHSVHQLDRVPSAVMKTKDPELVLPVPAQAQPLAGTSVSPAPAISAISSNNFSTGGGLLEGIVPSISVLIVEDNMINQRILETFMKKRKIRCMTAKNGREAVDKWRQGGIHLVFMDIQMPVMDGLEATREIRRLERCNDIGVFARRGPDAVGENGKCLPEDELPETAFRSPVIIVALTASSLQSDRNEALAAGCNDFLTKPVSLVWLEKKLLEWGCMQALIHFDAWRQLRN